MAKTKEKRDEATHFLEEGARSYLEAFVALNAFQHEVCSLCRKVVLRQLAELANAIGDNTLDKEAVKDWRYEPQEGEYVFLGVEVHNAIMRKAGLYFYFGFAWAEENGEPWFGIESGIWVRPSVADRVATRLRQANRDNSPQIDQDKSDIDLYVQLNPSEAGSFHTKLREQVDKWVLLGKKCQGFLKLLAEKP